MYTPPILYATQDDINERRKIRQEFRDKGRVSLIQSIAQVDKRDKVEKLLKQGRGAKDKEDKKNKEKNKKGKKKKKKSGGNLDEGNMDDITASVQLEKNASYREIQSVVDLAAAAGPPQIVRLMKANPTHHKVLALCCGALGDMAAFSRRDHLSEDKGMFMSRNSSQYHAPTNHICIAIGEAEGIKAILDAMVKHRTKDSLVLRGLWSLEHILEVKENWFKFTRTGGPQRLETIAEGSYSGPMGKKIAIALKKLKSQPMQGNHIRSQLCTLL